MIKGLISLFTSGAIFNPMILLGIICGIASLMRLSQDEIKALAGDYHFYLLIAFVSFGYVFGFKKEYKDDGDNLNYAAMIFSSLWGIVKFILAYFCSMAFILMLSF